MFASHCSLFMKKMTRHFLLSTFWLIAFLIACTAAPSPEASQPAPTVQPPAAASAASGVATEVATQVAVEAAAESTTEATAEVAAADTATPIVPTDSPAVIFTASLPEAQPGAAGIGDTFYPAFGNGGYDVDHYTLDLTVPDLATSVLQGEATIRATATQPLAQFNLDFLGFQIDLLTVNGQPAQFQRDGQEFAITPLQPLGLGESFEVVVRYSGEPPTLASQSGGDEVGWIFYEGGSYVFSEPDGAATFFPANDHPLDKATYTLRIHAPQGYLAAANGVLVSSAAEGGMSTFTWEERQPMASYLVTVAIGQLDLENGQSASGIPIRNYFQAEVGREYRDLFDRQGEMLDFYSAVFGSYPFETYGSLVVDAEVGSALEAQTLSVYGTDMLDLEDSAVTEQLIAHELAHQWFGDSLSLADWSDIWLNEGFASYAEGLWVEHTEGADALDQWVADLYAYAVEAGDSETPPAAVQPGDLFNEGVYVRGGLALHALRLEVGDETFFKIIQTYVGRYQHRNVRTADFIAVAEEISGKSLGQFFDDWLKQPALPPIPALGLGRGAVVCPV